MGYGYDFFRDTKIRYLGYANEIGEALRPLIDVRYVRYSYGIAIGYVLADTIDKAVGKLSTGRPTKILWATGDALIWQSLASLIIPGIAINRIVHYSNRAIAKHYSKVPQNVRAWMTVGIGLAAIPVIIHPIDFAVDAFMDVTYRRISE